MFKKNKFVKLTSGVVLSASVPTLASFAAGEKENETDWLMILKITLLCSTVIGAFVYIGILFNRKSELKRLERLLENAKATKEVNLKGLQKKAFQNIQVCYSQKLSGLTAKENGFASVKKIGVDKFVEKEFLDKFSQAEEIEKKIALEEKVLLALDEFEKFESSVNNIYKRSKLISCFFCFKAYEQCIKERVGVEEEVNEWTSGMKKYKSQYEELCKSMSFEIHESVQEMREFTESFFREMNVYKIEDISLSLSQSEHLKRCGNFYSWISGCKKILDSEEALSSKSMMQVGNAFENFAETIDFLKTKNGELRGIIEKDLADLKEKIKLYDKEKITEEMKQRVKTLNKDMKDLEEMRTNAGLLESTRDKAFNLIGDLDAKNGALEKKEFEEKWKDLTKGLKKEDYKDSEETYKKIMDFFDNKIKTEGEKVKERYSNLNKRRNFYKPWLLSENYD